MKERSIWLNAKLGEISREIKPGYPSGEHNSTGNGKLHFRPYNISNEGEVNLTQTKFVPLKNEDYYLKSQDIIFNNTNSPELLGKTCIINKDTDWVYSNHMTRIRLKPRFDPRFYARYLHYLKYTGFYKVNCSNHVNQASIASGFLNRNLEVPICPPSEQRAIVSKIEQLFSELDNGISNLKLAQEQLKVYRQAVLKKAFEGELTKKWREQQTNLPDARELLEKIRKERDETAKATGKKLKPVKHLTEMELEELPKLPKLWRWVKIDSFVENHKNSIKAGPFGSSLKKEYYVPSGFKIYGQEQVISGDCTFGDYYISEEKYKELESCKVKPFDVLISLVGTIGKVLILPENCEAGVINPRLIKLSLDRNYYWPVFFKYYFESMFLKSLYKVRAHGATMDILTLGIISELPFPLCSLLEQQAIVQEIETRLSVCDKIEQDIETNLEKAEALRQSILKKAFEGKLLNEKELAEVRGAEDWESAEVLLERIRAERAGK